MLALDAADCTYVLFHSRRSVDFSFPICTIEQIIVQINEPLYTSLCSFRFLSYLCYIINKSGTIFSKFVVFFSDTILNSFSAKAPFTDQGFFFRKSYKAQATFYCTCISLIYMCASFHSSSS